MSYRFRLARFVPSRIVHVGCPVIAASLELARIANKATRATFRKRDASPATFAIGNGHITHSFL